MGFHWELPHLVEGLSGWTCKRTHNFNALSPDSLQEGGEGLSGWPRPLLLHLFGLR